MGKIKLALCSAGELYGGVEQFMYTLSEYLTKDSEIDLTVIVLHKGLLYEKLKESKISIELVQERFKYDLTTIFKINKILKTKNINVVHTNGYKATILAGIAAKISGIKLIKTEHGIIEPAKGLRHYKMIFNILIDRVVSRFLLNAIVYVSKEMQNNFKNPKGLKNLVIYNGIKPIIHSANGKTSGFFNIGIIGRITEVKGHIYLLKALKHLAHLSGIKVYILGSGPLEHELKIYCHRNGISDKVHFMGFQKNIYTYLRNLDLLVMPSLNEGLPYTLLEAMYLKVPVVAFAVGGLKEVLKDHHTGILVPSTDVDSLANAIEKLYTNPPLRKWIAQNAFTEVSDNFRADSMAKRYIDVYQKLVTENFTSLQPT
ncbi:MAG: glycosyltransferase family 4 protein [Nitrospirae bacterium]|nr:glycosyltransferase family 4 protein [Nitrospirota bacterium]